MTLKSALIAAIFAATSFVATSAMSEEVVLEMEAVSIQDNHEAQVQAACDGYFGMKSSQGVYVCVNRDGKGIMCGGVTDEDKKRCHTFQLTTGSDLLKRILATPRPTESQEVFESEGNRCCVKIGGDRVCKSC